MSIEMASGRIELDELFEVMPRLGERVRQEGGQGDATTCRGGQEDFFGKGRVGWKGEGEKGKEKVQNVGTMHGER